MAAPLIMLVDDDGASLSALYEALARRYGADYQVVAHESARAALEDLERRRDAGEELALLIADQWMPEIAGLDVLVRARPLFPDAQRALFVEWGDAESAPAILQGCALGHLDNYLLKPWQPAEVHLYPLVGEFLSEWTRTHRPKLAVVHLVGRAPSRRLTELQDLLARSGIPTGDVDPDSEEGRLLLEGAGLTGVQVPVVFLLDGQALVDPSNEEVADALGETTAEDTPYDVAIVGAGPTGLAAAVYTSSEGLRTVVIEREAVGGQAGTSSLIRNYLGFPRGISGDELAHRAYQQAWLFGTQYILAREVVHLRAEGLWRVLTLSDGREVTARAVLIATGADYRRLGIRSVERFDGIGVYYTAMRDTRVMRGQELFVAGGGNSAGQAVVFFAANARKVTLLVRGDSLEHGMSDYLVREIRRLRNVEVYLQTEVVDADGGFSLERIALRDRVSRAVRWVPAGALFVLIGASPHTDWLQGSVARDDRHFILTADAANPFASHFGKGRSPSQFETSLPGVFAAGDVRSASVKRVTSAVGEGAIAVHFIHEYLARPVACQVPEMTLPPPPMH